MRSTTLLFLAALAGALVCAEDAPSDHTEAAPIRDTVTPISDGEVTTPAAPQQTNQASLGWQNLLVMKALLDKSLAQAEQAFRGAEKELLGKLQNGKKYVDGGSDFVQELVKKWHPLNAVLRSSKE